MQLVKNQTQLQAIQLLITVVNLLTAYVNAWCSVLEAEVGYNNLITNIFIIGYPMDNKSLGQCYHGCLGDIGCMSFFYNNITGTCQLHSIVFLSPHILNSDEGADYYRLNNDWCRRDDGYMLNRALGICFSLILYSPPYDSDKVRSICHTAGGGRWMVVDSPEKHSLVRDTAKNRRGTAKYLYKPERVSIGLTRTSVSSTWKWENNGTLQWAKWKSGEPRNYQKFFCVYMKNDGVWNWRAHKCIQKDDFPSVAACEIFHV